MPINMLKLALRYASRGLLIVPMHTARNGRCSCTSGKKCPQPGKHPRTAHGVKDATNDPGQIKKWWKNHPDSNVAVATGRGSGIVVLDIDPRNGGKAILRRLESRLGELPTTVTANTGGGGKHLMFKHPSFEVRKDSAGKLFGRGIDVLADDSLMIAPPSRHASGKRYRWAAGKSLKDVKPVDLPKRWLKRLRAGPKQEQRSEPSVAENAIVAEGQRNNHLTSLAGRLRNTGIGTEALLAALAAENKTACVTPLDQAEVAKIAASIGQYPVNALDGAGDAAEQVMEVVLRDHFAGGKHLMFCVDGQFWKYASRKWVRTSARQLQRQILATLERIPDRGRHSTSGLIGQVVTLLAAKVAVEEDRLGFEGEPPAVLNCYNGELWITDGGLDLRPHQAESYLRHCLEISYDSAAECPQYDAAVQKIFSKATDADAMVRHWHEFCGYLVAPRRIRAHIFVLLGAGSNGKTKLMQTVTKILGPALVAAVRIESLESNRFAIGSLMGKTVVVDDDVRAGIKLPDGELKKISEPKLLTGEHKFGEQFNFVNRAVPVLVCNNVPSLADLSKGMLRRLMVIPFDRRFGRRSADPDLFMRIWDTELSGVLNRALQGMKRLQERSGNFENPIDVKRARRRWLKMANPLPAFLRDTCKDSADGFSWMKELYARYQQWSQAMGFTRTQQQLTVGRNLEFLGYTIKHGNQGDKVLGLKLRAR